MVGVGAGLVALLWWRPSRRVGDGASSGGGRMPLVFRPKLHKTVELLVRLAHTRPGTSKYRAVKYVYLADLEHLNVHGRPITFEAYYALPSGPVPVNALNLIEGNEVMLQAAGLTELPFETYGGVEDGKATTFVGAPRRAFDPDQLSKSDVAVFDRIVEVYRGRSYDEIRTETHEHPAYARAWARRPARARKSLIDYADMVAEGDGKDELVETLRSAAMNV